MALRYISSNKSVTVQASDTPFESEEPRHWSSGETPSEVAARWPEDLWSEPVSFSAIARTARYGFDLTEEQMAKFIYESVIVLLDAGTVPVEHSDKPGKFFRPTDKYGTEPEEIAANVVKEWRLLGDDPDMERVWFDDDPDDI